MNTISRNVISDAMEMAGLHATDTIEATYSGKGMNGEACLSFTLDGKRGSMRRLARFAHALGVLAQERAEDDDMDLLTKTTELVEDVSMDDLGLDMIVYFPGWRLED